MDIIDYDTEHSLATANLAKAVNPEDAQTSLAAQRRLIRKQLPEVPAGAQSDGIGDQSYILGRSTSPNRSKVTYQESCQHAKQLTLEEKKKLDWWPDLSTLTYREKKKEENFECHAFKLNSHYRKHLLSIIECSLERSSDGTATCILEALEQCLESLGQPDSMQSLQRSFSLLWRIEALIRSNEQLEESNSSKESKRWPRLVAWRGASSSNTMTLSSPVIPDEATFANSEARRRKRDVALQLLSNTFWIAGPSNSSDLPSEGDVNDANEIGTLSSKSKTFPRKSAPQLLVRSGIPTVALQKGDITDGKELIEPVLRGKEPSSEHSSVLTNRLAMQLKKSEGSVRSTVGRKQKSAKQEDENRMTICKVCCDFVDYLTDEEFGAPDYRRNRSGTITLAMHRKQMNDSQASTRSNRTLREYDKERNRIDIRIDWKANQFQGDSLSLNPLSSEIQQSVRMEDIVDDSRVRYSGGSFLIESPELSMEEQEDIRKALNLGLYVACAMMLEIATLGDFGVVQGDDNLNDKNELGASSLPQSPSIPEGSSSIHDDFMKKSDDSLNERQQRVAPSRWPKSVWGIIHYGNEYIAAPLKRSNSTSNKDKQVTNFSSRRQAGKHLVGYGGRLGKVIGSITGTSHRQTATSEDISDMITGEGKEDSADLERDKVAEEAVEAGSKDAVCPLHVSPHYSEQMQEKERRDGSYLDIILADQCLTLNIVEGSDMTLPIIKPSEQTLAPRASLQSRHSYSGTDSGSGGQSTDSVVKGTGSSISSSSQKARSSTSSTMGGIPIPSSQRRAISSDGIKDFTDKTKHKFQFYRRFGSAKDICLGQILEEMAAKAKMLHQKTSVPSKKSEDGVEKNSENIATANCTYQIAQYLHSHDRILITATIIPSDESGSDEANNLATEKSDVAAVAKASRLNHDLVRSAIFLAEHLSEYNDFQSSSRENGVILLWNAEIGSKKVSSPVHLSSASYLRSYGAFIKDLLSHPHLITSKYTSMRFFRIGNIVLKFLIQPIVVFDLLVEGPVVVTKKITGANEEIISSTTTRDKKVIERTRSEIRDFYASVKRHITGLEHILVARDLDERGQTIKSLTKNSKKLLDGVLQDDEKSIDESSLMESIGGTLTSAEPLSLLSRLKKVFRTAEFELYDALKGIQASYVNDIRIKFRNCAKSAQKRLASWEEKHLTKVEVKEVDTLDYLEPEYFAKGKHAFPGSLYLVRQDEPLSLIAYCLSSKDYNEEVSESKESVMNWQNGINSSITRGHSTDATSSSTSSSRGSTLDSVTTQDRDEDKDDFHDGDNAKINLKRKRRTKDASILSLSLKRVSSNISSSSVSEIEGEAAVKEKKNPDEDNDGSKTPTALRNTPLEFNTVSSTSNGNEIFIAQVESVTHGSSLGGMFEGPNTASSTPFLEKDESIFPNTSISASKSSNGIVKKIDPVTPRASLKSNEKRDTSTSRFPPSPHIKHSITAGNLKFSCVSWFAEDFATLRDKWKINSDFIQSMSRCKTWNVGGGKSKSGFYLSLDEKWIAKQLLNIWSVDEKEAFLEFAPAYLRYMMNSVSNDCPTLLVKIAGVYTIKIKDIKTGEVKLKISIQVLENVFSGDDGNGIRFDIKGIKDRKVSINNRKEGGGFEEENGKMTVVAPVWWDAEFLECFSNRAFVPESQKEQFMRGLHNDLAFLTASNIIDYSLLIGAYEGQTINSMKKKEEEKGDSEEEKKSDPRFCVRIVDFLGAFTLVKYIESSSKKAIRSQAPTVIPPQDYATRFAQSVKTYFISCPD